MGYKLTDEQKYRAWDKRAKKMREVADISFWNSCDACGSIRTPKTAGVICKNIITQQDFISYKEIGRDIILNQCTGMRDEKGTLIFTDDIVKYTSTWTFGHGTTKYNSTIFTVKFEVGSFMLVREKGDMTDLFEDAWNDCTYPLSQLYFNTASEENIINNLEVLGNVYNDFEYLRKED